MRTPAGYTRRCTSNGGALSEQIAVQVLTAGQLAFGVVGLRGAFAVLSGTLEERGVSAASWGGAAILAGCASLVLFPAAALFGNPATQETLESTGQLLLRISFASLALFVRTLFRPRGSLGWVLVAVCVGGLVASLVAELASQQPGAYDPTLTSAWISQASFAAPLAWAAWETGREAIRMWRRVRIGLTDPLTASGTSLWAFATATLVAICVLANACGWALENDAPNAFAWLTLLRGLLYFPLCAAVWLGLFPPRWFRERLAASPAPQA